MKTSVKLFYWLPRIICMLAILFVSLFAADAFQSNLSMGEQLADFAIHLIPSFILLGFLLIAWKWEFIGGIIFTVLGLVMTPVIFYHNYNVNHFSVTQCVGIISMITVPFMVVGVLFIISHFKHKKMGILPGA
jgi:hypothetical protein